jgi:hypothetical protein
LLVGTFVVHLLSLINHDTAWYLEAGAQFLQGGELYRDIFVEVNPPLGFFLTLPPVVLSHVTGLFVVDLFIAYFYLLILVALVATWQLLGADTALSPVARRGMLILVALILTICPSDQFGEREHFLVTLALPYLLLVALRAKGLPVPHETALAVGLVAGLGFALKPHFLLVPLALEAYRLASLRRLNGLLRAETLGLATTFAAYAAVVIWATPEYLTRIVPYALEVYNEGHHNPVLPVVWRIETVMLPIGCLVHFATRRHQRAPHLGDVFMISSAGLFFAYVA